MTNSLYTDHILIILHKKPCNHYGNKFKIFFKIINAQCILIFIYETINLLYFAQIDEDLTILKIN